MMGFSFQEEDKLPISMRNNSMYATYNCQFVFPSLLVVKMYCMDLHPILPCVMVLNDKYNYS
jgi:hypothetical protein